MKSLSNEFLTVGVSPSGAELKSIVQNGYEHIWQGDEKYWARSAPILFPVVGKPFNNEILVNGKKYPMPQHGFARDMNFEVVEKSENKMVFRLQSTEETQKKYPFRFDLQLSYTLIGNTVECGYEVLNTGNENMYFSIGAHPGFNLPSKKLSDYYIEFEKKENSKRSLLNDGLLNGKTEPVLQNSKRLDLTNELFGKDAIVFKDIMSEKISLCSKTSSFKIEMSWKDFPYFGIWCKKNCEEFICLEPWCGIAGSTGSQIPIEEKEGINKLLPDEKFERKYSISFYL